MLHIIRRLIIILTLILISTIAALVIIVYTHWYNTTAYVEDARVIKVWKEVSCVPEAAICAESWLFQTEDSMIYRTSDDNWKRLHEGVSISYLERGFILPEIGSASGFFLFMAEDIQIHSQ